LYIDYHGNIYSEKTFRVTFDTNPPTLTQLGNQVYPRANAKIVAHGDYVYLFGGLSRNNFNIAERMKIGEWRWSLFAEMKEGRWDFGVYVTESRIYLLGGCSEKSVEYYDIYTNNFYLLPNIQLPEESIVCAVIGDLIYAVGRYHLRVFNKDFQLIQSQDNIINNRPRCFSDVIVRGSTFIYINNDNRKVYSFDSTSRRLKEQKSF
jgi:hypothetical protein